jgi:hypothetical protein
MSPDENMIPTPPDDYCVHCDRPVSECGPVTVSELAAGGRRARQDGRWESDEAVLYESRD